MKESYITANFKNTAHRFPAQEAALNAAFAARMAALRKEYAAASEETKRHLESQIMPGIAAYETLQVVMPKEEALESYKRFFEDAGYTGAEYIFCDGRVPCAVAVIQKQGREAK